MQLAGTASAGTVDLRVHIGDIDDLSAQAGLLDQLAEGAGAGRFAEVEPAAGKRPHPGLELARTDAAEQDPPLRIQAERVRGDPGPHRVGHGARSPNKNRGSRARRGGWRSAITPANVRRSSSRRASRVRA